MLAAAEAIANAKSKELEVNEAELEKLRAEIATLRKREAAGKT